MVVAEMPVVIRVLAIAFWGISSVAIGAMPVDTARSAHRQANGDLASIQSTKAKLEAELDLVARQIEKRKASAAGTKSADLDSLLRKSHELAASLESVSREEATAANRAEAARSELSNSLDAMLLKVEAQYAGATNKDEARHLVDEMKSLRIERDGLRASVTGVPLPVLTKSGDPTELIEQADALRDTADKLRRELKLLDVRIHELQEERELDRRMRESQGRSILFDESDRRLSDVAPSASFHPGSGPEASLDATGSRNGLFPPTSQPANFPAANSAPTNPGLPVGSPPFLPSGTTQGLTDNNPGAGTPGPSQVFGSAPRASATEDSSREPSPSVTEGLNPQEPPPGASSPFPPEVARPESSKPIDDNASLEDLVRRRTQVQRQSEDLLRRAGVLESQAQKLK
jgi:hypothetical protein